MKIVAPMLSFSVFPGSQNSWELHLCGDLHDVGVFGKRNPFDMASYFQEDSKGAGFEIR